MGYPSRLMEHRPPTPPSGIPGWLPPAAIAVFAVLCATGKSGVLALLARSLTSFPYELVYAYPPRGSIAAPMTRTASEGEWG
jgi:hypothetical protein